MLLYLANLIQWESVPIEIMYRNRALNCIVINL